MEEKELQQAEEQQVAQEQQEEEQQVAQEEKPEVSEEQLQAEAEFFSEEGFEIEETITKDDVYALNIYILKNNPSNWVGRILFMIMGVIVALMPLFDPKNWWAILIGVPLIAYGLFIYMPLQASMIRRNIAKKNFNPLDITLRMTKTKVLYKLKKEEHAPLVNVADIIKVVKTPNYIYMHLNAYSVMVIKLEELENSEEIINKVKEQFVPLKKYKEKK